MSRPRGSRGLILVACLAVLHAPPVLAQSPPPAGTLTAGADRHEAEQNLVNLPTTQPLRRFGHHFRITHRFARDLRRGTFGELASDLFGLDNGAVIGLDYRFAPMTGVQVGIYRSMLFRTIQVSGRLDAWRQGAHLPASVSLVASVEGTNNMRGDHAPALGAAISRTLTQALALHAAPLVVWNTAAIHDVAEPTGAARHTAFVGLGSRVRVRQATFVVTEFSPRIAGYSPPGRGVWAVALEKQTRGHLFQINLTNSFGTTYGQTALGGERSNIYLGFNLARRW